MGVIILPLVSLIHPRDRWKNFLDKYILMFQGKNVKIYNPIMDESDIPLFNRNDYVIIIHLTGGTSSIATKIAKRTERPVTLIAYGYNNSLPSAISAKNHIIESGKSARIIYSTRPKGSNKEVEKAIKIISFIEDLSLFRVLLINKYGKNNDTFAFEKFTGSKVLWFSFSNLLDMTKEKISKVRLSKNFKDLDERLVNIISVLTRFIKKRNIEGILIDCFSFIENFGITPCTLVSIIGSEIPFACEEDYRSFVLLAFALKITGKPGWIANFSGIEGNEIIFSHCTAASKIISNLRLVNHFETEKPISVTGNIKFKRITAVSLSKDFKKIYSFVGTITKSGMISKERCRLQAYTKVKSIDKILKNTVANHHVIMSGNVLKDIELFSFYEGLKFNTPRGV